MAVTVAQLKELREAGVKRVVFAAAEITEVEFFDSQPVIPEQGEPVKAGPVDDEIPPDHQAAFNTLLRKPQQNGPAA